MTVYVRESSETILSGLSKMKAAMVEDYHNFPVNDDMKAEYADKLTVTYGTKYIKISEARGGVLAFVVGVDNDKKFKKGDILKPAGYAAPARNGARGNILEGGYPINWTGPLYFK
ncbi:MAG: hypothetical protein QGH83_07755 [Candidatus Pacebacteria bacterium]|jgi:hypothetical protein|nr:hypothetical protein [Candidatus Paceibacterota bacterium]